MALRKQIVKLVFDGLQSDVDPKIVSTDLIRLDNARRDRVGSICKRYGTAAIQSVNGSFITKYQERPIVIDDNDLRIFDGAAAATTGNFDVGDSIEFCDIETEMLSAVKRSLYFYPDIGIVGSTVIIAYTEYIAYPLASGMPTYTQWAETFDLETGQRLDSVQLENGDSSTSRFPRIGTTDNFAYVWYANSSDKLSYHTVTAAGDISATASWSDVSAYDVHGTNTCLDVCNFGNDDEDLLCVYIDTSGDLTLAVLAGSTGTVGITSVALATDAVRVAAFQFGTGEIMVSYSQDAPDHRVMCQVFNAALTVLLSETAIETGLAGTVTTMTGGSQSWGARAIIYYTMQEGTGYDPITRANTMTNGGTAGTAREVAHRLKIASRPFGTLGEQNIILHHRSAQASGGSEPDAQPLQSCYYLFNSDDEPVGKCLMNRAGPGLPVDENVLGGACSVVTSGSQYVTGALMTVGVADNEFRASFKKGLAGTYDDIGYAMLTVTMGVPSELKTAEQGLLFIPNSTPYHWDGQEVVEQNFCFFPEGLTLARGTGGGSLGTGQYGWAACYEWIDGRGQTHRSSPSPMITVTPSASQTITITVPTLTVTFKSDVKIVLYRTYSNGSVLYRHMELDNDATADYVTFVDTFADADHDGNGNPLDAGPRLYTTGNLVENIAPQPHRVCCIHQGRIFYVDREAESTVVRYSRYLVDGDGPGWNDVFQILVPEEGGAIKALASFMDRLVIFKETAVYACYGNGLTDAGTGPDYSVPLKVTSGYGCKTQKSLVEIPDGLVFLAHCGLCLMTRDFQVVATFGLPVKRYTDAYSVCAAVLIPELEHAMWLSTAGEACVYNYRLRKWSTYTSHACADAVESGGVLYAKKASSVMVENRSSFLDGSSSIPLKLLTGWIPLQEAGYGRLYSICVIGQNIASHVLNLHPRYDLDPHWDADDLVQFNAGTFGAPFDVSDYYSDAGLASSYADKGYELIAGTRGGKRRVVQFMIFDSDVDASTPTNEGFSISQVYLLVGVRDPWLRKATAREMS